MKKIALFHRYGIGGHMECGGHFLDIAIEKWIREGVDVHYYGYKSYGARAVPHAALRVHSLPFFFRRSSGVDKLLKTILWYFFLPFMCLHARICGIQMVFADETLPLTSLIYVIFFGRGASMTVADFFLRIYAERYPWMGPVDRLITWLDAIGWKHLGAVLTKTNAAKAYLVQLGVSADRIYTIYNSCDLHSFRPVDVLAARRRFGISSDAFILVHHGILHPNKGNDRIIRTLPDLLESTPNLLLLLVGDGPEKSALEQLAKQLGVQKQVKFTGWLETEADVNEALNTADVGLVIRIGQTSDHFHVTDTLTHEMSAGLPIIAANLAGIAEIIKDGETGFLFSPDDMDEFKAKLRALYGSPDLRNSLAEVSRSIAARKFDVQSIGEQIAKTVLCSS